jgi:hypothetical protein
MLSMLQQGILARAKAIVEEKDYTLLCKRANICPICGSGLIKDRARWTQRERLHIQALLSLVSARLRLTCQRRNVWFMDFSGKGALIWPQ